MAKTLAVLEDELEVLQELQDAIGESGQLEDLIREKNEEIGRLRDEVDRIIVSAQDRTPEERKIFRGVKRVEPDTTIEEEQARARMVDSEPFDRNMYRLEVLELLGIDEEELKDLE